MAAASGGLALGFGLNAFGEAKGPGKTRKLGVALCGLGSYATGQLGPALRETRHCELRAVVTGDPEKGRRWAREYGFPESSVYGYDSIHKLAENADVDILYSVTPPSLHKRDTIRGFEAGKHVITEKPMALDVKECDEMIRAARKAGRQLSVGYRLHFHPYYEALKQAVREGTLGSITKLSGGFGFPYSDSGTWRTKRDMGGGPLMDVGIYVIYCAAMAKNEAMPVAVRAKELPKTKPELFSEVEEAMEFVLEYADGSTCNGETSWVRGQNHFRAEGADGWLEINPAFSYDGLKAESSNGQLQNTDGYNQQAAQMDAFAKSIIAGEEGIVPGTIGRREMQVIEAIREAARTGKRITL